MDRVKAADGPARKLNFTHQFFEDLEALDAETVKRTDGRLRLVETQGIRYPGLETRRVRAQRDAGFHLVDVDNANRMVVYIQGDQTLFMRVGRHDPIERWAETASMADYVARDKASVRDFPTLPSWPEIRDGSVPTLADDPQVPDDLLEHLLTTPAASDLVTEAPIDFLDGYRDGSIEDWMIFLSPMQSYIVQRRADGPSRVSGGPGTGKTVVALHRASRLADELGPGSGRLIVHPSEGRQRRLDLAHQASRDVFLQLLTSRRDPCRAGS